MEFLKSLGHFLRILCKIVFLLIEIIAVVLIVNGVWEYYDECIAVGFNLELFLVRIITFYFIAIIVIAFTTLLGFIPGFHDWDENYDISHFFTRMIFAPFILIKHIFVHLLNLFGIDNFGNKKYTRKSSTASHYSNGEETGQDNRRSNFYFLHSVDFITEITRVAHNAALDEAYKSSGAFTANVNEHNVKIDMSSGSSTIYVTIGVNVNYSGDLDSIELSHAKSKVNYMLRVVVNRAESAGKKVLSNKKRKYKDFDHISSVRVSANEQ